MAASPGSRLSAMSKLPGVTSEPVAFGVGDVSPYSANVEEQTRGLAMCVPASATVADVPDVTGALVIQISLKNVPAMIWATRVQACPATVTASDKSMFIDSA